MTTIEFKNGIQFPYLVCFEAQGIFGGIERKTLQFEISRCTISLGDLDDLLSNPDNLEAITLKNDGSSGGPPVEYSYDNYVCFMQLAVNRSGNNPGDEIVSFTLGQRVQLEIENMNFKTEIAKMQASL